MDYEGRKYTIQQYDPTWLNKFKTISSKIKDIFGKDALVIEHVGSTSVPGMVGKPVIDVLVLVEDISIANAHSQKMIKAGYEYLPNYVMPDTALFRRKEDNTPLENIHIFKQGHHHILEIISLRNYLRNHPEEVKAYSSFKVSLFNKYPKNYEMYRKFKDEYMSSLMSRVTDEPRVGADS